MLGHLHFALFFNQLAYFISFFLSFFFFFLFSFFLFFSFLFFFYLKKTHSRSCTFTCTHIHLPPPTLPKSLAVGGGNITFNAAYLIGNTSLDGIAVAPKNIGLGVPTHMYMHVYQVYMYVFMHHIHGKHVIL